MCNECYKLNLNFSLQLICADFEKAIRAQSVYGRKQIWKRVRFIQYYYNMVLLTLNSKS